MFPYLLRLGALEIPAYPILYGLGIALGGIVILVLGARRGLDVRKLAHVILLVSFSIVFGGRAFYVLQHLGEFRGDPASAFALTGGGQVLYGGLLLTIVTLIVSVTLWRLPLGTTADLFAVAAPLGLAVGRLGCFCRGCCFGKVSAAAWATEFPAHVDIAGQLVGPPVALSQVAQGLMPVTALRTLPVHPSQVYASGVSLVVFAIMVWLWRNGRFPGHLVVVYAVLYAFARFGLEFTRENAAAFSWVTIPQVVSVLIVVVGVAWLVASRGRWSGPVGEKTE